MNAQTPEIDFADFFTDSPLNERGRQEGYNAAWEVMPALEREHGYAEPSKTYEMAWASVADKPRNIEYERGFMFGVAIAVEVGGDQDISTNQAIQEIINATNNES